MKKELDKCGVCGVLLQRWQTRLCIAHESDDVDTEKALDKRSGKGAVPSDSDGTQGEKALETVKDSSAECAICGGKCLER